MEMSWIAAGVTLLLLGVGAPVGAEEFSMIVGRGSTVVRVTGSEDGEFREETLREDPTPERPPAEMAPGVDSEDSPPEVEEAENPPADDTVVVVSRVRHHRHFHVRHDRHRSSRARRVVRPPGSIAISSPAGGAEKPRRGPTLVRSPGRFGHFQPRMVPTR
jgi:hypothetical protein